MKRDTPSRLDEIGLRFDEHGMLNYTDQFEDDEACKALMPILRVKVKPEQFGKMVDAAIKNLVVDVMRSLHTEKKVAEHMNRRAEIAAKQVEQQVLEMYLAEMEKAIRSVVAERLKSLPISVVVSGGGA
jgi:tRNA A37 threonylcarbamoyltransferase TsaD